MPELRESNGDFKPVEIHITDEVEQQEEPSSEVVPSVVETPDTSSLLEEPETAPLEQILSVEDKDKLSLEARHEITMKGLAAMRDIFKGIDDYVIFSSTAMYLCGLKYPDDELARTFTEDTPGDIDVSVDSIRSLEKIREHLRALEDRVVFEIDVDGTPQPDTEGNGVFTTSTLDGAKQLKGYLLIEQEVDGTTEKVKYPFEFFTESSLIDESTRKMTTQVHGMNTLTRDGLIRYYEKNLSLDKRVTKSAQEKLTFINERLQQGEDVEKAIRTIAQTFELNETQESELVAQLITQAQEDGIDIQSALQNNKVVELLTGPGLKNKIRKRMKRIATLRGDVESLVYLTQLDEGASLEELKAAEEELAAK